MELIFLSFLPGLEKLVSEENFSEENVALVTFGHETKALVRSTKELSKIRNAFGKLQCVLCFLFICLSVS